MISDTKGFSTNIAALLAAVVTVGFAVAAGACHMKNGGVQTPAVLATMGAIVATFLHPVAPWRWGVLSTLSIPGGYVVSEFVGAPTSIPTMHVLDLSFAFAGPFAGAYLAFGLVQLVLGLVQVLRPRHRTGEPSDVPGQE